MSKGIVAFEVVVTDLQAKKKLSQNKTVSEQNNIINSLSKSSNCNEQLIADYMRINLMTKK
jgi:transcriptional regulator